MDAASTLLSVFIFVSWALTGTSFDSFRMRVKPSGSTVKSVNFLFDCIRLSVYNRFIEFSVRRIQGLSFQSGIMCSIESSASVLAENQTTEFSRLGFFFLQLVFAHTLMKEAETRERHR